MPPLLSLVGVRFRGLSSQKSQAKVKWRVKVHKGISHYLPGRRASWPRRTHKAASAIERSWRLWAGASARQVSWPDACAAIRKSDRLRLLVFFQTKLLSCWLTCTPDRPQTCLQSLRASGAAAPRKRSHCARVGLHTAEGLGAPSGRRACESITQFGGRPSVQRARSPILSSSQ